MSENDLFPPTDITEDWLKLTDFDPENVIKLAPIRPRKKDCARLGDCLSAIDMKPALRSRIEPRHNMIIQFGTETEIGIARDKEENLDVVAESMALVRSATKSGVLMRWDYDCEDPHADMRGFHVRELRQDTDEASYFAQDAERELSFVEIKSDLVLGNGARYYNDHAHPEYCTPECSTVEELIAHDRAGERILMRCAQKLSEERGRRRFAFTRTTRIFAGTVTGAMKIICCRARCRGKSWPRGIQAFLVTRQIIAGAGKFAIEEEDRFVAPGFQISQRSDFFSELQSVDTMQRRPIVNTRDEPHANPNLFRRFHVILGDANMSPFSTRLKIGTTALVLEALARDPKRSYPVLADPLQALVSISRDCKFHWEVALQDKKTSNALDLQREYLQAVKDLCDLSEPSKASIVADWDKVLAGLGDRPDAVPRPAGLGGEAGGDPGISSVAKRRSQ